MTKNPPCPPHTPSQLWSRQTVAEIAPVETKKESAQVIDTPGRAGDGGLAPVLNSGQIGLPRHLRSVGVVAVAAQLLHRRTLAKEPGDEDEGQGLQHIWGRGAENIGDPDIDPAIPNPDRVVEAGRGAK